MSVASADRTGRMGLGATVAVFLAFAFAYFFSALLRAITATLAPVFSQELQLGAADLGILAGAYFLGFSLLQLPLGSALDRFGPKRVLLGLLSLAVCGCAAFAVARSLGSLFAARFLIGMGVAACLMAPLTCYRLLFTPTAQLRANSWMLMTGSLGMLASTMPVQWLLPVWGWRGIFWGLAVGIAAAMVLVAWVVPRDRTHSGAVLGGQGGGYGQILRDPEFLRNVPVGFFVYGGMVATQALWAGPWLTRVGGLSPVEAAKGLFLINACMLIAFLAWGIAMPRLLRHGLDARRLITLGLPLNSVVLAAMLLVPHAPQAWEIALWCVSCTVITLSQPALGQAFPAHLAGRALSAFNLVMFAGIFVIQWSIGMALDLMGARGVDDQTAFRLSFGVLGALGLISYAWYVWGPDARTIDRTVSVG